jgi:hypothetical protein
MWAELWVFVGQSALSMYTLEGSMSTNEISLGYERDSGEMASRGRESLIREEEMVSSIEWRRWSN